MNEIPRYKQEIEASGLSQKEWYAKVYLKSDHWKALKKAKAKEVGRKCEICGATKKLEFHHDNYRDIYDVTTADLRILCHDHHHEFHYGVKPSKKSKSSHKKKAKRQILIPDFSGMELDFESPNLAESIKPFIRGLNNSHKNLCLNMVIKRMRSLKLSEDSINAIIILKSGAKARRLKAILTGGRKKWNKFEFEKNWADFCIGKSPSYDLGLEFQVKYDESLRSRQKRELNLRMLELELKSSPLNTANS